ncbi:hypothetical protein AB6D11_00100 [Vibrio splendidus]
MSSNPTTMDAVQEMDVLALANVIFQQSKTLAEMSSGHTERRSRNHQTNYVRTLTEALCKRDGKMMSLDEKNELNGVIEDIEPLMAKAKYQPDEIGQKVQAFALALSQYRQSLFAVANINENNPAESNPHYGRSKDKSLDNVLDFETTSRSRSRRSRSPSPSM